MNSVRLERWEDIFRLLTRDFQIQGIGTQIDLVAPGEFAEGADLNRAKDLRIVLSGENAFSRQGSEIDDATFAVVEGQREFISILGRYFDHSVHSDARLVLNAFRTKYSEL